MRHRHPTLRAMLALALLLSGTAPMSAQSERVAPSACQRARSGLGAELSREAASAPKVAWSTELASRTAAGATITASQRALYARARRLLDHAGPLLDSIRPLHVDVDAPAIEQTRPHLRTRMAELAAELGRDDGPRSEVMEPGLRDAGVHVARLGLVLCRAGALDEEEETITLGRYVRLEHAMAAVRRDWIAAGPPRREISIATGPSIAPGMATTYAAPPVPLTGVSDTLDALTLALDSVTAALDAWQQSAEVRDSIAAVGRDSTRVPLAGVLARLERFATEEVPRVLEAGGVDALPALTATTDTLRHLVRGIRLPAASTEAGEERDARSALDRLAQRLDALYRLLNPAPPVTQ